ncbi:MAG: glycosyltransferase involved in cell wall biosynthesis, partial [Planctomycetota bacterium]
MPHARIRAAPYTLSMTEISVVIPCLNEADTLEDCILRAQKGIADSGVAGEVVVGDNGSVDASIEIAERLGARVVHVPERGYGSALMGGITAAKGSFIVMGDADGSYDFLQIPRFYAKHKEGFDLVQGCRLPAGGGTVAQGAMPWLHRWIGNPALTFLARRMFHIPIHDIYCGLRGFTRSLYDQLDQRCTGMEFAVEMIIKSSLRSSRIAEIPITLHPDGRKAHAPHLRTFRDGWRTLRYFLLFSPRWLYLIPGILLCLLGLVGYALVYTESQFGPAKLGAHSLLFASLALLCGFMSMLFGVFARTFATTEKLVPPSPALETLFKFINLERCLVASFAGLLIGAGLLATAFGQWQDVDYGDLDYGRKMLWVIPGFTIFS